MTQAQLDVLNQYGTEVQIYKVIEELAELIHAYLTATDFDEELADVAVMMETLWYILMYNSGKDESYDDPGASEYNTQYSLAVEASMLIRLLSEIYTKKNKPKDDLIRCIYRMKRRVYSMTTDKVKAKIEYKLARLADRVKRGTVM